jgi:hypothetical protein
VLNISGGRSPAGQTLSGDEELRGLGDALVKFPPFYGQSRASWVCTRSDIDNDVGQDGMHDFLYPIVNV